MTELKVDTTITFSNAWDSKAKIQLHQGSARSGKSFALLQYLIVKAISEVQLISVVRKTFPALRTSAIRDFKDIMRGMDLWDDNRWMATEHTYTFDNDSVIEFFSTDSAEKLKGLRRNILWIDEANELNSEQFMQLAIRTTGQIILSYNPSFSPKHWIIKELSVRDDVQTYITTYKDNPYLPLEQVRFIEKYRETNPRYWQTYGLGQFAVNEKQIYDFEVIDEFDFDTAEFVCFGLDIGYVSDPTALIALWKSGDKIIVNEHIYQKGLITADILSILKETVDSRDIIIVESSEPRLIDEIKKGGFPLARGVKKGKDSVNWGIDLVKKYRIVVPKVNTNLIEELYSYEWVDDGNGGVTNTPVDANNHLLDAMRYAVMEQMNAKKINAGNYAITIR